MSVQLNCPECGKHAKFGKNHCEGWGKNARLNCVWVICTCKTVWNIKSGGSYKQ